MVEKILLIGVKPREALVRLDAYSRLSTLLNVLSWIRTSVSALDTMSQPRENIQFYNMGHSIATYVTTYTAGMP